MELYFHTVIGSHNFDPRSEGFNTENGLIVWDEAFLKAIWNNILWLVFCVIVVTTTARVTVNTYDNFAIVLGTDDIMRWWFIVTMPVCFILLATRAIENIFEDFAKYRAGDEMIQQAVIGGDA